MRKEYLADSVYVEHRPATGLNGDIIILTTENGVSVTNTIYLDETVMLAFDHWRRRLKEAEQTTEANAQ